MDYGIYNVHTDVNAYDCTRGCTDIVRESALKANWEKNPLLHRGIEPVPVGPMVYQLSYIPIGKQTNKQTNTQQQQQQHTHTHTNPTYGVHDCVRIPIPRVERAKTSQHSRHRCRRQRERSLSSADKTSSPEHSGLS